MLLIVTHSRSGTTQQLAEAVLAGVGDAAAGVGAAAAGCDAAAGGDGGGGPGADDPGVSDSGARGYEVRALDAFEAGPKDVLAASGVILGTPARFGYMSGAMKDFLERIYAPCLGVTGGLPWALFVKGDTDVAGATSSVERIITGLAWRRVLPVLEVVGDIGPEHLVAARELGGSMAAGLAFGLW